MKPKVLSQQLREQHTPDLDRRRAIIVLSMIGAGAAQIVSLYQTGVIDHLPDPPIAIFDSDRVDASDYAYRRMDIPDGFLMLITYGVTAALAAAGGKDRAERQPLLPVLMGGKIAYDVMTALKLGQEEWAENKALCAYCQAATVASVVSLVIALPEALKAAQRLFNRR